MFLLIGTACLTAPAVEGNFGVGHDIELAVEEWLAHRLCGDDGDGAKTSLDDTAATVKRVIRGRSLQKGGAGISVAMECAVLLPGTTGPDATRGDAQESHRSASRGRMCM